MFLKLSQIVRVLNGHLSQLQWIDQNAAQLQAKIQAAQKASHTQISNGAREADSADEFYRSFMGSRRYFVEDALNKYGKVLSRDNIKDWSEHW